MNIINKMKKDWNRRANHNARYWIATSAFETDDVFADSGENDARRILEGLEDYLSPSWHVLEIGCGIGRLLKPLASRFHHLCGIDVSKEMIEQSKDWLKAHPNVETHENSGINLSLFPDNSFDLVYSYIAFQHMPEDVFFSYLPEITRVLKPQGLFKFQIALGDDHQTASFEDTITVRIYEEGEILKKLEAAGFQFMNKTLIDEIKSSIVFWNYFFLARATANPRKNILLAQTRVKECSDTSAVSEIRMCTALANKYMNDGDKAMAIKTLEELLFHTPDNLDAWLNLANLQVEDGRLPDAITTMQDLMKAMPTYYKGQVFLVILLKAAGRTAEATEVYNTLKDQLTELSKAYTEAAAALVK